MARPRVTLVNEVAQKQDEAGINEPINKKRKPIMAPESVYQPPAGKYSAKIVFDIKGSF
jgi:hypothetical protein